MGKHVSEVGFRLGVYAVFYCSHGQAQSEALWKCLSIRSQLPLSNQIGSCVRAARNSVTRCCMIISSVLTCLRGFANYRNRVRDLEKGKRSQLINKSRTAERTREGSRVVPCSYHRNISLGQSIPPAFLFILSLIQVTRVDVNRRLSFQSFISQTLSCILLTSWESTVFFTSFFPQISPYGLKASSSPLIPSLNYSLSCDMSCVHL
ncbi:hypothetical protein RvY_10657 [Ramazzottius varieornatus]|uniref:Uncharacterized protein n=1 Tax=Ramazzottius varieornatus TaxID=947166 RepID=A0A1D1VDI0_RAMVA|nr:hypothetical protein RvY_10657 [Ramazzottius varieornatus]